MLDLACDDFETFVASLPAVQGRYLQTKRTVRTWRLRILPLGDVTVMRVRGGAVNVFHGAVPLDQLSLYLPLSPPDAVALGGERIGPGRIGLLAPGHDYLLRTDAVTDWLGIHIPLASVRHRFHPDDPVLTGLLANAAVIDLPTPVLQDLVSLAGRLRAAASAIPSPLAPDIARRQGAQQLLEAIFLAFASAGQAKQPRQRRDRRHRLVARCMAWVEQRLLEFPTVEDLCALTGLSDRTLRTLFVEQIGLAPHQYLMKRRMQAIHQAMRRARATDTVTAICARYGVWDLGRFAGQYRRLYGTLPSADLAQARTAPMARGAT